MSLAADSPAPLSTVVTHLHIGRDGKETKVMKTRGGDQGDAITALTFPLTYRVVSRAVQQAIAVDDPSAREYTFQDDLEVICLPNAVQKASDAFDNACARVGMRANPTKATLTPGLAVDLQALPSTMQIENRALVLKHGGRVPLPALPSQTASGSTQLAERSPEVERIAAARTKFFHRLRVLKAAGLPAHTCHSLARHRTGGDYVYVARACGIPATDAARFDEQLKLAIAQLIGLGPHELDASTAGRLFCIGKDGSLGFQSIATHAPAAYAASWHTCLPKVITRIGLASVSALTGASPWAAQCIPIASRTLHEATRDPTVEVGDPNVNASQRLLALAPLAAALDGVRASLADAPLPAAAFRSSGGRGAFTWMLPPTEPDTTSRITNSQLQ